VTTADEALLELLRRLGSLGYDFVTVTPETHQRVVARRQEGRDLRDALGWSLPVPRSAFPPGLFELLDEAGALERRGELFRSRFRVSRVDGRLFLHSAFPTDETDAVFLGPDTYRFVRFINAELPTGTVSHLVDMGAGCGVGAICIGARMDEVKVSLVDSNSLALRLARINAAAAGLEVETLARLPAAFDLYIANPPYLQDSAGRTYRDGGAMHGAETSLLWTLEAAQRIAPGGRILLYTGVAILGGADALRHELERRLPAFGCTIRYEEIDPDIFGSELEEGAYAAVERIAAVGAVIDRLR